MLGYFNTSHSWPLWLGSLQLAHCLCFVFFPLPLPPPLSPPPLSPPSAFALFGALFLSSLGRAAKSIIFEPIKSTCVELNPFKFLWLILQLVQGSYTLPVVMSILPLRCSVPGQQNPMISCSSCVIRDFRVPSGPVVLQAKSWSHCSGHQ